MLGETVIMNINHAEVLHYLGYKGQQADENTTRLIDECLDEIDGLAQRKYVYEFFTVTREEGSIALKDSILTFPAEILRGTYSTLGAVRLWLLP